MAKRFVMLAAMLTASVAFVATAPAGADPIDAGTASAYGVRADVADNNVITVPEAAAELPPGEESSQTNTVVPADVDPLIINSTLTASAAVHAASDLGSVLEVNSQAVDGPYNSAASFTTESLEVLLGVVDGADIGLVSTDEIRSEAVAVCANGQPQYSANSEIVNLDIGGEDVPLNGPLEDILGAIGDALDDSGLDDILDIDYNEVTELEGGGIAVNALHISVLQVTGAPLADVIIGHAEVGPISCAPADLPECSDGVDNDDPEDTLADEDDPGCHTDGDPDNPDSYDPNDDDETDVSLSRGGTECSDGVDNDDPEDSLADIDDPGCHTDGDATNPASYDPTDDSELDDELPRTGLPLDLMAVGAAALGAVALGMRSMRRRAELI